MATTIQYPLPKFHFQVQWGGVRLGFTEVTGLTVESGVIEYREGLSPDFSPVKMPGMLKYSNITLKRGTMKGDNDYYAWWAEIALNTTERRDITISLLDESHQPVVNWNVRNAFACKVDGGNLNSTGNEVAIETLEIAHEGLSVQNS